MSETLRVTLDGHNLAPSEVHALENLYFAAAKRVIPPAMVSSIRMIFRHESHGTTVEPFLGNAAFEALLRVPKKRAEARSLLALLVGCAFFVSDEVGVLLLAEDLPLPFERTELAFTVLCGASRLERAWYRVVAPLSWFHFTQIEAKLLQPLTLPSGHIATHYFREFWIRAVEREVACGAVAATVEVDGGAIVNLGGVTSDAPPREGELGNLVAGGHIYFSDRGN